MSKVTVEQPSAVLMQDLVVGDHFTVEGMSDKGTAVYILPSHEHLPEEPGMLWALNIESGIFTDFKEEQRVNKLPNGTRILLEV